MSDRLTYLLDKAWRTFFLDLTEEEIEELDELIDQRKEERNEGVIQVQ